MHKLDMQCAILDGLFMDFDLEEGIDTMYGAFYSINNGKVGSWPIYGFSFMQKISSHS